jgi:hypothetical protein
VILHLSSLLIVATDYGWTGWVPSPDVFCLDVLPILQAANMSVPNEVVNGNWPQAEFFTNQPSALEFLLIVVYQTAIRVTSSTLQMPLLCSVRFSDFNAGLS